MTPDQIHKVLTEQRKELTPSQRVAPAAQSYFLGAVKRGKQSTRVLRVSAHPSNSAASKLKLPAATRENAGKEVVIDFAGSEAELLRIVDREIERLRHLTPIAQKTTRAQSMQPVPTASVVQKVCHQNVRATSNASLTFSVTDIGIDHEKPLLYMWEIFDANSRRIGVYVGKASNSRRPLHRYKRVTAKLLANAAYSFRRIHNALGLACREGHRVALTLVCNVPAGEDIFLWESALILAMDSHGPQEHQLNGTSGESARGLPLPSGLADTLAVLAQRRDAIKADVIC